MFALAKICPICGKEFKGLGHICKDGDYCNECEKKVRLVFQEDEETSLPAARIRQKLDRYADAIAAYDSVKTPENCPICGKKLPKLMKLRLLDGYLCMACAEKAGELLHTGTEDVRCRRLSEITPLFETAVVQGGKTDSSGVFHDADSLRIVYPLIRTLRPSDEFGYDEDYIDPLDSLSGEELQAAPALAEKRREELQALYGLHRAVFEVDGLTKLYNESRGRRTYRDEYRIGGRVLLGRVAVGDRAVIRSAKRPQVLQIRKLGDCREYNSDLRELKEGAEGGLFVQGAVSFLYPGDILTID